MAIVTLETVRKDMKTQLDLDNSIHVVEVNADTLDECLADASTQLETKIAGLEYEILERGSDGFFGLAKKPWKVRIYQNSEIVAAKKKKIAGLAQSVDEKVEEENKIIDKDGLYYIRHFGDDILVKVLLPVGEGKNVDAKELIADARRSDTLSLDEGLIKKLAKSGTDGKYEIVGKYKHVKAGDASLAIDISKDDIVATVTAMAPAMGGAEISADMIVRALETQGVVVGIENDKIDEFVDNPVYGAPCEVAHAIMPHNGNDAYMQYNFEIDSSKLRAKETEDGKVNFKELNQIQNVVKGQPLAVKIPLEKGKGGKTLGGNYMEAKDGRDIKIPLGQNVELDKDGVTVIASIAGRVMFEDGRIKVDPVIEYDSIGIKTGNIEFLGSVIVKGNVDDGYNLKATGNIEIGGTVGKSSLISEHGNIIVARGIFGHDEGSVKCGKSLWTKFIQSAKVEVEDFCIVSDSIMNSEVSAMKRIILNGKKAQITGGHLFATEEIAAKNIGSPGGGTETILEVGFDPRLKHRLEELQNNQNALVKELEEIENNILSLENIKKQRRVLPPDKQKSLDACYARKDQIANETEEITGEMNQIQEKLREMKQIGKVKASGNVYSGVKIYIRDTLQEVRNDMKSLTFFMEGGFVRTTKYEAPDMTGVEAPEGYSS